MACPGCLFGSFAAGAKVPLDLRGPSGSTMCFSAEMDVAAGVVIGSVGVDALRHVRRPKDLPLASLPLAFGAHQLTEAFVWLGLKGEVAASTGRAALWMYMAFAFVVLPLFTPLAVLMVEPDEARRRRIGRFAALGTLVSLVYADAMLSGPIAATVQGRALGYQTGVTHGGAVAALYMLATVGALLSSSHRRISLFGAANLVALPVLVLTTSRALTSLWCLWAALASVVIAGHQRAVAGTDETPPRGRARPRSRPAAPTPVTEIPPPLRRW